MCKQCASKSINHVLFKREQNESALITETEFKNALNVAGFRFNEDLTNEKYHNLITEAKPSGHIESKRELGDALSGALKHY